MKIRTRFAPSPTGYMHVGNLRTALYTYLTAKHADGTFILRIEDTDRGRLITDSIDVVYKTMRETGLNWDEGPDIGGPVGPYIQSQRMSLYKQYAEESGNNTLTVIASTASPYKFTKSVLSAVQNDVPENDFDAAYKLNELTDTVIPKQILNLKNAEIRFGEVISKGAMKEAVLKSLGI